MQDASPTTKGIGELGRKRPPEEIARAKASAALTRRVNEDPTLLKGVALSAVKEAGGNGPAMVKLFSQGILKEFGVQFGTPALRAMLDRLRRAGILSARKVGTAYEWGAGSGRAERKAPTPRAAAPKAARTPQKRGRKAKAAPAPKFKKSPGRPRAFKGGEAATQLVKSLASALAAAEALAQEMAAVAEMRDNLRLVMKSLG